MKKKSKYKKVKEISLPMKFNIGLQKYEPVLPVKNVKSKEVVERKINWWAFVLIIIFILLFAEGLYFLIKYFMK